MTELQKQLELAISERDVCLKCLADLKMTQDLERIKREDDSVCDLHELGEQFINLIECGIDALVAYRAVRCSCEPKPAEIGQVCAEGGQESEFYSSRELDRLTAKDLENPAVYKKAIESLKKL